MAISPPLDSPEQSIEVSTASVKQEVHLPSDSDDDFIDSDDFKNIDKREKIDKKGFENIEYDDKDKKYNKDLDGIKD